MRLVLVLAAVLTSSLADIWDFLHPRFCNDRVWIFDYDPALLCMGVYEMGKYMNQGFNYDVLLFFKEVPRGEMKSVMYDIDGQASECIKRPLEIYAPRLLFQKDDCLIKTFLLSIIQPHGEYSYLISKLGAEQYMMNVTELDLQPAYTEEFGWAIYSYYYNVTELTPNDLRPPWFCSDEEVQDEERPVKFLRSFFESKKRDFKRRTFTEL